jgi:hypothetical protein
MEQMVERVTEFASNFRPSQCTPHDVVFMSFLSPFIRMCRAEITVLESTHQGVSWCSVFVDDCLGKGCSLHLACAFNC